MKISEVYEIKGIEIIKPNYEDNIELFIQSDSNDGDYVSTTNFIKIDEFKELLPIFKKILTYDNGTKWSNSHNWENKEVYLNEDEISLMNEYTPSCEWGDCHTIVTISAWYLCSDGIRYEIKL